MDHPVLQRVVMVEIFFTYYFLKNINNYIKSIKNLISNKVFSKIVESIVHTYLGLESRGRLKIRNKLFH